MKTLLLQSLKLLVSVVVGYAVMVLAITLVQEVFFNGVQIGKTPIWQIGVIGIGTVLSAFLGGYVSQLINRKHALTPQIIMSAMTVVETIYLISNNITGNPIWFEIPAELSLIFGIMSGGYYARFRSQNKPQTY